MLSTGGNALDANELCTQVPGEQYKYWVGQHEPVWSFQAPLQPAPDAAFSFVVYGDMGEADHKAAKSPGWGCTAAYVLLTMCDIVGRICIELH